MAARNTPDAKRFVSRAPHKKPEAYLVPTHQSETSRTPRKTPAPLQRSSPMKQTSSPSPPLTRRSTEAPPARRVVVVRSPNNSNVHRGPVDLGDFGQPNAIDRQPVLSNEHTAIYLIRRPIPRPGPSPPHNQQPNTDEHKDS